MNYYVAGKLLWNAELDEKRILDDFYSKAFRRSGPQIQRYHRLLQEASDDATREGQDITCSSLETTRLLDLFTPELLQQCGQALDEAERLADDDVVRKRIEFYRKGFQYTQLTVEAVRRAKDLFAAGVDIMNLTRAQARLAKMPKSEAQALIENSLNAWEERQRYVEALKNDYVVSYFWITYNDTTREFNPVDNLRIISGMGRNPGMKQLTNSAPSQTKRVVYIKAGQGRPGTFPGSEEERSRYHRHQAVQQGNDLRPAPRRVGPW